MKILVAFIINNSKFIIIKDENGEQMPEQLLFMIAGITIGTGRGMFAMCIKDTIIENAILPIINVKDFFINV